MQQNGLRDTLVELLLTRRSWREMMKNSTICNAVITDICLHVNGSKSNLSVFVKAIFTIYYCLHFSLVVFKWSDIYDFHIRLTKWAAKVPLTEGSETRISQRLEDGLLWLWPIRNHPATIQNTLATIIYVGCTLVLWHKVFHEQAPLRKCKNLTYLNAKQQL